jgi:hypothetical protein
LKLLLYVFKVLLVKLNTALQAMKKLLLFDALDS